MDGPTDALLCFVIKRTSLRTSRRVGVIMGSFSFHFLGSVVIRSIGFRFVYLVLEMEFCLYITRRDFTSRYDYYMVRLGVWSSFVGVVCLI